MPKLSDFMKEKLNIEENMDIYYLAFLLLMSSHKKKFDNIPELCLVLDEDNFERFMDVFEGQTIKVPTKKQYSSFVKSVLVYAYMQKGYTQKEALKKANVKGDRTVYNNLQLLDRELYKMRIPHDKLK